MFKNNFKRFVVLITVLQLVSCASLNHSTKSDNNNTDVKKRQYSLEENFSNEIIGQRKLASTEPLIITPEELCDNLIVIMNDLDNFKDRDEFFSGNEKFKKISKKLEDSYLTFFSIEGADKQAAFIQDVDVCLAEKDFDRYSKMPTFRIRYIPDQAMPEPTWLPREIYIPFKGVKKSDPDANVMLGGAVGLGIVTGPIAATVGITGAISIFCVSAYHKIEYKYFRSDEEKYYHRSKEERARYISTHVKFAAADFILKYVEYRFPNG